MTMDSSTANKKSPPPLFGRLEKIIAWTIGFAIIAGFILVLLWRFVFVTIPPGHTGVLFSLLGGGTVKEFVLHEGLVAKLPWNRIFLFEVRTQRLPYHVQALSAEGMSVTVDGAALFRPRASTVPEILTKLGLDYPTRIIEPLVRSIIRDEITQLNSNELYSVDHEQLQRDILLKMRTHSLADDMVIDDLVITEIRLPTEVSNAIDIKLAQEQRAAGYEFLIAAEQREAERLRVQAIGLRNFYSIVSDALNDTLLTWRGIEATVQLAQSPNSKVVIVGSGKDQLPLILGSDIANVPSTPVPVPPVSSSRFQLPDWNTLPPMFPNAPRGILNSPATNQPFPAQRPTPRLDPSDSPGSPNGDAGQKSRSETGTDLVPGPTGSSSAGSTDNRGFLRRLSPNVAGNSGGPTGSTHQFLSSGVSGTSGSDNLSADGPNTELSEGVATDVDRPLRAQQ